MQVLAGFDEGFAPLSDGAEKSIARSRIDFLGQGFIRFLEKDRAVALWGFWKVKHGFCCFDARYCSRKTADCCRPEHYALFITAKIAAQLAPLPQGAPTGHSMSSGSVSGILNARPSRRRETTYLP